MFDIDEDMDPTECGLTKIANAILRLGNADAATPMGGLEALGKVIEDGCMAISASLDRLASAVQDVGSPKE